MKRVASIVLALTACVLTVTASWAAEAKKVTWNLAMSWNSTLTPFVNTANTVAKMVNEMTGGNFVIKIEGAEKHKAPLEILDMVKGGHRHLHHRALWHERRRTKRLALLRRRHAVDAKML